MGHVHHPHADKDDVHTHTHADSSRALLAALAITLGFAGVEAVGGWLAGSLALLSDAAHMLSDSVALGLAAAAARMAARPPSHAHTFGLVRAEVMAALANSVIMVGLIIGIGIEAVHRFNTPLPVAGATVMLIAAVGLGVNLGVAAVLSRGGGSLNARAALMHVMGDLLGSFAALVAGAVVWLTGWTPIDPLLSLFVAALILVSAVRLLREALHVLMEGVPAGIDIPNVERALRTIPGVVSVHDLHIWSLGSGTISLTAHLEIPNPEQWQNILAEARNRLAGEFHIEHVTVQPEIRPLPRRH